MKNSLRYSASHRPNWDSGAGSAITRPMCARLSGRRLWGLIRTALLFAALPLSLTTSRVDEQRAFAAPAQDQRSDDFVHADGSQFRLHGHPYFVAGVNNHYLTFGSKQEIRRVLDDAVAMHANVVRTFLQPVIGSPDGSTPTIWNWQQNEESSNLGVHGVYLLYWDSQRREMKIHPGPNGMRRVDFLLAEAAKHHLKLLIAFLDFWSFTGGAQQMRAWYGSHDKYHFFFVDSRTRADYRVWVKTVIERRNTITGVRYRDDPTIFAWELMNEPEIRPASLRQVWIGEMARYVKSLDPYHMVTSGLANVADRLADRSVADVDFLEWHGYPAYYNLTTNRFNTIISEFCQEGHDSGKPVLLEEFGYARSNADQAEVYRKWLRTIQNDPDCAGWLVWRLVSRQDNGRFPRDDYDKFDIHNDGGPTWRVLREAAQALRAKSKD